MSGPYKKNQGHHGMAPGQGEAHPGEKDQAHGAARHDRLVPHSPHARKGGAGPKKG